MVTRLTGGNSPGDGADPRTFPVVYDELVDAVEAVTPVPDPAAEADGRMLHVAAGALAYTGPAVSAAGGGLETVAAHGATGATQTFDLTAGNVHTATQDQACAYTFAGATAGKACSFTLLLTHQAGSATWPASVKWADATAPTLSGLTALTFVTVDGGASWLGMSAGKAFA
jgi:hypothetical protein